MGKNNMMFGLMNMKNYRGNNMSTKQYKTSNVKFCFKLYPVTRWHMSSEDIIQPSKWSVEPDREWHVNAMLNNKPQIKLLF